MSTRRRFKATDLFKFNAVNLDTFTETFDISFYLTYLTQWPELFIAQQHADGMIMGYVMGKNEGRGFDWHTHVTAVTVAPEFRRIGLAKGLMAILESSGDHAGSYFVDLFVRRSNQLAIEMYEGLGYGVFRCVAGYYTGAPEEDAFDMRKCLSRDVSRQSVKGGGRGVVVQPEETIF